jgi:hypothetical protein
MRNNNFTLLFQLEFFCGNSKTVLVPLYVFLINKNVFLKVPNFYNELSVDSI